jgi:phenylpyruvate tautomerase PptA (4-oxalocrotonate tautomerase family)
MPYLKVNTNANINNQAKILKELSLLMAKETGKPERYVMIELAGSKSMLFSGSSEPLAYLECKSIGLSPSQIQSLAASLNQLLNSRLQIPSDRIYIEFSNCSGDHWGWNGSTF